MRKSTLNALRTLSAQATAVTETIDFHPMTRDRRFELAGMIKGQVEDFALALAAARKHPATVGRVVDLDLMESDMVFITELQPIVDALTTATRCVADEVLVRKARVSQGAFAVRRLLDASLEAESFARAFRDAADGPTNNQRVASTADIVRKGMGRGKRTRTAQAATQPQNAQPNAQSQSGQDKESKDRIVTKAPAQESVDAQQV